ncbi:MAG: NupC/NupG family nucleoside CNT transporter [Kiritimatiellia bacterium]
MNRYNLISFLGLFLLMALAWVFSGCKRPRNWRVIVWGTLLQLFFALIVFVLPAGTRIFLFLNDLVVRVLDPALAGAKFVFGRLALGPPHPDSLGVILAFQVFPTIIFFSALVGLLYYWRILPFLIRLFARVFTTLMRVSGAESLCAASNIFVGVESALAIQPHLGKMTRSELCTVLTAGMATIASSVFGAYVLFLRPAFPNIAGHLISASILSAPAALVMSKLILPETETPTTLGKDVRPHYERESSPFEAVIVGANSGMKLVGGIVALLIAVLGLVALADLFLGVLGRPMNRLLGLHGEWTIKGLLGYVFYPLTAVLGIPLADVPAIARIIGERTVATEFAAYQSLAALLEQPGSLLSPRSAVLAAYALCGFAHVASLGIFVGGTAALCPSRIRDLAAVGPRALLAATLACLMTACAAGTFLTSGSILLGG